MYKDTFMKVCNITQTDVVPHKPFQDRNISCLKIIPYIGISMVQVNFRTLCKIVTSLNSML